MSSSKSILSFFLFVLTNVLVFGQCSIPITATPNGLGVNGVSISAPTTVGGLSVIYYNWDFGDGSSASMTGSNSSLVHDYPVPGTYNITLTATLVSNAQCSDSVNITITNPVGGCFASFNALPSYWPLGYVNLLTAQAAGGTPPYSYFWSNGDTGQAINVPSTFNGPVYICLSIYDSTLNCSATYCDTVYAVSWQATICYANVQPTSGCNGVLAISNDFISSSCEGTLVAYPPGSVDFSSMWVNGDTLFFNTCDTVYSIGVVDSTGTLCSYSIVDSLISTASIIEMEKNDYAISPIPNNGEFKLHGKVNHGDRLQLTNLYGKTVYQQVLDEPSNLTMVRVDLSPGTYTLTLKNAEGGETYRNKIVIIQ